MQIWISYFIGLDYQDYQIFFFQRLISKSQDLIISVFYCFCFQLVRIDEKASLRDYHRISNIAYNHSFMLDSNPSFKLDNNPSFKLASNLSFKLDSIPSFKLNAL